MSPRLPLPPGQYSQQWANQLCAAIERELRASASSGQAQSFGDLNVNNLDVAGTLTVHGVSTFAAALTGTTIAATSISADSGGFSTTHGGGASLQGDLAFGGNLTVPGVFTINSVATTGALFRLVAASSLPALAVWSTSAAAGGPPAWNLLTMAHLPDWVEQGQPDSTVTTIANSVAPTALGAILNIPANSLSVGDCIRMTCRGVYGSAAALATLALDVRNTSGVAMCQTGANNVAAVSMANRGWEVRCDFIVNVLGGLTGRLESQGMAVLSSSAVAAQIVDMEQTAVPTFNTTVAQSLQLFATWGTAAAANTITCRQTIWEILKQ